jgi:hypothetical protein
VVSLEEFFVVDEVNAQADDLLPLLLDVVVGLQQHFKVVSLELVDLTQSLVE